MTDVSCVLLQYTNSYVVAACTVGFDRPGSRIPVSLGELRGDLTWGMYVGELKLPAYSKHFSQRETHGARGKA